MKLETVEVTRMLRKACAKGDGKVEKIPILQLKTIDVVILYIISLRGTKNAVVGAAFSQRPLLMQTKVQLALARTHQIFPVVATQVARAHSRPSYTQKYGTND